MAQKAGSPEERPAKGRWRRWPRMMFRILMISLVVAVGFAWYSREEIAETLITDYFEDQQVPADYTIATIGAREQVLTDITIGDPARPDLTIDRLALTITPRLGLPSVTRLEVTNPRLYGEIRDGALSFGSLDPLIFTDSDEPFEFPDMEVLITDGRGRIASDAGAIGLTLTGEGHLRGGFAGELAVLAEQLEAGGCLAQRPTLYGAVRIDAERPVFDGPLRFDSLECADMGLSLGESAVAMALRADRNLADFEGEGQLRTGNFAFAGNAMSGMDGDIAFSWRNSALTARYDLAARGIDTSYARIAALGLTGDLRSDAGMRSLAIEGQASGEGVVPGGEITNSLEDARLAAEGTLLAPLLGKFRGALVAESRGSTLAANFTARQEEGEAFALVVPEARWLGTSGATLLSLSRLQMSTGEGLPQFDGNFVTGGANMPRISGRMEQAERGALTLRLAMQEYRAGDARLQIPRLTITPRRGDTFAIAGLVRASGDVPGGAVEELALPLDGTISSSGALALWNGCRRVTFDQLTLADLAIGQQALALCPQDGAPMLRFDGDGLQFAARSERMDIAARYGDNPLRLTSGPLSLTYPGAVSAPDLRVSLGAGAEAIRFAARSVTADLSGEVLSGRFDGAEAYLPAIPLDITNASGVWSFADAALDIGQGALTVTDRQEPARFNALVAKGATLRLADSLIEADAVLRHPFTNAEVVSVDIEHNLASGVGWADLLVQGLTFTDELQPRDLTNLAVGVVANVEGTVTGEGRIDWNPQAVTSDGTFSSDGMDFAAAFGPVEGARGSIVFTDLLDMTTAPNQRIDIAAINPGIEVNDGQVGISIVGGTLLRFEGGEWPLLGGTMVMRPVDINVGAIEERTYLIEIEGLEANQFIESMELNNLAANGTFDGTIPIVFDEDGNGRLEGGILVSRPSGGNLAYVGELTYEDLGTFGNYAFGALRDLSFRRMEIQMDGPLTGELVTQVRFDSIGQGKTAQSNFVTRQIAKLPIELRVNIRAPFYQLMSSTRSLYDPSAVRDPRDLGLIEQTVAQILNPEWEPRERDPEDNPDASPADELRNEPEIQPSESERGL